VIQASQFVEPAKQLGFDFWAGVPCSYLTPFINYTIARLSITPLVMPGSLMFLPPMKVMPSLPLQAPCWAAIAPLP